MRKAAAGEADEPTVAPGELPTRPAWQVLGHTRCKAAEQPQRNAGQLNGGIGLSRLPCSRIWTRHPLSPAHGASGCPRGRTDLDARRGCAAGTRRPLWAGHPCRRVRPAARGLAALQHQTAHARRPCGAYRGPGCGRGAVVSAPPTRCGPALPGLGVPAEERSSHGAVLQAALRRVLHITETGMGNVQLAEHGMLRLEKHTGLNEQFTDFFAFVQDSTTACAQAARQRQQVTVKDVESADIFDEDSRQAILQAGSHAAHSLPLISRAGQVIGLISSHHEHPPVRVQPAAAHSPGVPGRRGGPPAALAPPDRAAGCSGTPPRHCWHGALSTEAGSRRPGSPFGRRRGVPFPWPTVGECWPGGCRLWSTQRQRLGRLRVGSTVLNARTRICIPTQLPLRHCPFAARAADVPAPSRPWQKAVGSCPDLSRRPVGPWTATATSLGGDTHRGVLQAKTRRLRPPLIGRAEPIRRRCRGGVRRGGGCR
ncbi:GAF domain-containing protein [Streptomyces sp. NPDC058202]|uniref:GAF domain-containing protein n=1 Tax=Streptomyces sp. NPDC058202 TaxID=3346380 RepID=UPI0036E4527D